MDADQREGVVTLPADPQRRKIALAGSSQERFIAGKHRPLCAMTNQHVDNSCRPERTACLHNMSDAEIARLLGKSRGAIALKLFRSRARLKKLMLTSLRDEQ